MDQLRLDEYCKKILSILLLIREKIRFNELYRTLNQHGVKISRPTLSEHLRHLTKQKILMRRREGKQKVTYRVNFERFEKLDKATEITKELVIQHYRNEKKLKSFPMNKQVGHIHSLMVLQELLLLKLEMLYIFEPHKKFEHTLSHFSLVQHFGIFKKWFLDNLRENPKKFKEEATEAIVDLVDYYLGDHFVRKESIPAKTS